MFDKSSWPQIASEILGAPVAACKSLDRTTADNLDAGSHASYITPFDAPGIKLWCSWHKNTIKVGVLLPRRAVWSGATLVNGTMQATHLDLHDSLLGVLVEQHVVRLSCPVFMLCNDDVIRMVASWHSGLGLEHPELMSAHALSSLDVPFSVAFTREITRKAGLFVKDTSPHLVIAQAKTDAQRMGELARAAIAAPVHIPETVTDLMAWLRHRFFTFANHPTSHTALAQAYMAHAVTIIEGIWRDTTPTQVKALEDGSLRYSRSSHAEVKHTMLEVLCTPAWAAVRKRLLLHALSIKRTIVGTDNAHRKSLDSIVATQALYLVHKFGQEAEQTIWFSDEQSNYKTIMESTFTDIGDAALPFYMMYALSDELERRGFSQILDVNARGLLEVKDWTIQDASGKQVLRLNHDAFFPAMLAVWQRHKWTPRALPPWVHQVVEARFAAGDLRVADMLSWHPECVRVLAQVCSRSARRARWLVSWLAYHPHVVDPSLMPALFLLDEQEIAALQDLELSAIYEHLERAPTALRREHLSKTKTIVACAVSRLGAESFDLLDDILKDAMSADLMAHITATIDSLPRLSSKRRALKREQNEALDQIEGTEHFGMLTVHEEEAGLRGALSHADKTR